MASTQLQAKKNETKLSDLPLRFRATILCTHRRVAPRSSLSPCFGHDALFTQTVSFTKSTGCASFRGSENRDFLVAITYTRAKCQFFVPGKCDRGGK